MGLGRERGGGVTRVRDQSSAWDFSGDVFCWFILLFFGFFFVFVLGGLAARLAAQEINPATHV